MRGLSFFALGIVFAAGLGISGMTQPLKVLGFLDIFGTWDPALAFVMGAALLVTHFGYNKVLAREQPLLAARFDLPTRRDVDLRLVAGASLFGVGWGMVGFCPGPALVALVALGGGSSAVALFVIAMFAGFLLQDLLDFGARAPGKGIGQGA